MLDPLLTFHTMLRGTGASGYPQANYYAPHPYAMSMFSQGVKQNNDYQQQPFQYSYGRNMRLFPGPLKPQKMQIAGWGGESYGGNRGVRTAGPVHTGNRYPAPGMR